MKIIRQLPPQERKAAQKTIDELIMNRNAELAIFERNIIKPLKDAITAAKEVRASRLPLDAMLYTNRHVSEHIQKFLEAKPKEGAR
jgi:hypothetical protein